MGNSNIKIVKNALNEFSNGNLQGYVDACHSEFYGKIWSGLIEGGDEIYGKNEFIKFMDEMNKKIIVKKFEPVNWAGVGDTVYFTVNWEFIWKETNTLIRTNANVRKVIRDGKIVEKYHIVNYNDIKEQIGRVNPNIFLLGDVKDYNSWYDLFLQHGTQRKLIYGNDAFYDTEKCRAEFVDESKTEVWSDIESPNIVVVTCFDVDLFSMSSFMSEDPAMTKMTSDFKWELNPPQVMKEMIPELNRYKEDMFVYMDVENSEKWINGFKEHGFSKNISGFEESLPYARSEFCKEDKTRIFKHANIPNRVGVLLYEVKTEILDKLIEDENMKNLTKFLGEKENTKVVKILYD